MTAAPRPARDDVKRSIDDLVTQAHRYRTSGEFRELLDFMARFRRHKPFNGLLIHAQRPGARFVAPAHRWHDTFQRRIKPGQTPLVALQPFGPVMFVYDVSQTEPLGDSTLPDDFAHAFAMPPMQGAGQALPRVVENAKVDGVRVARGPAGALTAGCIRTVRYRQSQPVVIDRRTQATIRVPVRYEAVVDDAFTDSEVYATLTHELGHLYCGHLGTPDKAWWPDRRRVPQGVAEFEAETVAYLACQRVDAQARMPAYLDGYLDANHQVPEGISLDVVTKAAGMVIDLAETWLKPRKPGLDENRRASTPAPASTTPPGWPTSSAAAGSTDSRRS